MEQQGTASWAGDKNPPWEDGAAANQAECRGLGQECTLEALRGEQAGTSWNPQGHGDSGPNRSGYWATPGELWD